MKKVLFLINDFSKRAGTERVTSIISSCLANDYSVGIISIKKLAGDFFDCSEKVEIHDLGISAKSNSFLRKIRALSEIRKNIKHINPDIIICVEVQLYLYCYFSGLCRHYKCIAWEHFSYSCATHRTKIIRQFVARKAECLIVLSEGDCQNYQTHIRNIRNIVVIKNPSTFKIEKAELKRNNVIAVGRLDYQKDFESLINAWAMIEGQVNPWTLQIWGEGPLHEKLQNQINNLGLRNVYLMGFTDNVEKQMMESSIFCMTSKFEGYPMVLLEAISKGMPCVLFDFDYGPREIITDKETGRLIPMGNIEQFALALKELIECPEERELFSNEAIKIAAEYQIGVIAKQWNSLIESIISC